MTSIHKIRLGTRGSPLAMKQANTVKDKINALYPHIPVELVVIKTSGDWTPAQGETPLSEIQSTGQWAGKGLFTKEIQQAILRGEIDAAVHSMKDVESHTPDGLITHHMLEREDPRDAVIISDRALGAKSLKTLPPDCVIGTSSIRRTAFLLYKRWDLKIEPLRGNVQTRIDKMNRGQADAILLAAAGLKRLGLADKIGFLIEPEDMLPSPGQGAIGLETADYNTELLTIFDHICCKKTMYCVHAERAAVKELNGSCHTPIGAYALINDGGMMHLRVAVAEEGGHQYWSDEIHATALTVEEAQRHGKELGRRLKAVIPEGILPDPEDTA